MKTILLLLFALPSFMACSSTVNKIFGDERTPHEKYADRIETTEAGKAWVNAAAAVLNNAQQISLPYSQLGYFPGGKARALALQFSAKRGERVVFELPGNDNGSAIYADIFQRTAVENRHLASADTSATNISVVIEETGDYIIRLQPPLERAGEYRLIGLSEPSLQFPVAGKKARVGSVWGDSRDGGKRSHEGIDIFAAKRTPVVAAADGYITRVNNGGLGGKTVSMRPRGSSFSLYYAHLDEQWVSPGQQVAAGDTLGLVGNTGNARTTPPHLHFGIYAQGGAVDPLPFVNRDVKKPAAIPERQLSSRMKLIRAVKLNPQQTIQANTEVIPLAFSGKGYIAELPDGSLIEAPVKSFAVIKSGS